MCKGNENKKKNSRDIKFKIFLDIVYILTFFAGAIWSAVNYIIDVNKYNYAISASNFYGIALKNFYIEKGYYLVPRFIICLIFLFLIFFPFVYDFLFDIPKNFKSYFWLSVSATFIIVILFFNVVDLKVIPNFVFSLAEINGSSLINSYSGIIVKVIRFLFILLVYAIWYLFFYIRNILENKIVKSIFAILNATITFLFCVVGVMFIYGTVSYGTNSNARDTRHYEIIQDEQFNVIIGYDDNLAIVMRGEYDENEDDGDLFLYKNAYKKVNIENKLIKHMYFKNVSIKDHWIEE